MNLSWVGTCHLCSPVRLLCFSLCVVVCFISYKHERRGPQAHGGKRVTLIPLKLTLYCYSQIFILRGGRQDRLIISYLKGSVFSLTFSSLKGTGWSDLPVLLPDERQIWSSWWSLGTMSKRDRNTGLWFISFESMNLKFFNEILLFLLSPMSPYLVFSTGSG